MCTYFPYLFGFPQFPHSRRGLDINLSQFIFNHWQSTTFQDCLNPPVGQRCSLPAPPLRGTERRSQETAANQLTQLHHPSADLEGSAPCWLLLLGGHICPLDLLSLWVHVCLLGQVDTSPNESIWVSEVWDPSFDFSHTSSFMNHKWAAPGSIFFFFQRNEMPLTILNKSVSPGSRVLKHSAHFS